ncbi:hypothetical protein LXA43DRAFT_1005225 [Ganoderma leucocontextum]|nr:hypothetical protein LXA43DRAFT_1005225 [Ganoderma leucocontextum]
MPNLAGVDVEVEVATWTSPPPSYSQRTPSAFSHPHSTSRRYIKRTKMTVVFPSSHSPMSSIEYPSAPRTPPPVAEASEVNDDNRGQSSTDQSSQAHEVVQDNSICEDFLAKHLRASPASFEPTEEMNAYVDDIREAGTSEPKMYKPAASLLTAISKQVYTQKDAHKERQHIRNGRPGHLTFIDHHSTAPTHFIRKNLAPSLGEGFRGSDAKDAPDVLGVYDVDIFKDKKDAQGVYKGVPHHRVEAIVEAKSETNGGGRRQATTYAYRHHQARPDRPGFYVLVIKPQWYQVLYSDPTGVFASPKTLWTNTNLLAAYIYSHYHPPANHFLWDDTIRWSEPDDEPCAFPSWEIHFGGERHSNGRFLFIGEPWGRLTNIFDIEDSSGERVIIKDGYRHVGRRFKEEDILGHLHAEGDLFGAVRLKGYATVLDADGGALKFILMGDVYLRSRERFSLLDTGSRLLKAESVNDLLKAVFDALEVHRTQLVTRNILHRDMSIYNILMYPKWGNAVGRPVMEDLPPTIEDVLAGTIRPVVERFPACLVIDYDNSARLDRPVPNPEELTQRTGTPMYIARGVCAGKVLKGLIYRVCPAMPELSGTALDLYIRAHGEERYQSYNDKNGTLHGALPPPLVDPYATPTQSAEPPPLYHRPEHDVESIYWAMISALLRLYPEGYKPDSDALKRLAQAWEIFESHQIPKDADDHAEDLRQTFLNKDAVAWEKILPPEMKDVAVLLCRVSMHVNPEYALWQDGLPQDHLHEAVQRLILQYLVEHEGNPIPLDPSQTRPITASETKATMSRLSAQLKASGSGTGSASRVVAKKRGTRGSRGGTQLMEVEGGRPSVELAGPSTRSRTRNAAAGPPVIIEPKRKSDRQAGRRSKRVKSSSGTPLSIEEDDEENDA